MPADSTILIVFLFAGAYFDIRHRMISHHVWILLLVFGLTLHGPWWGGALGWALTALAGLPDGDNYFALGLGLVLGIAWMAAAVGLALVVVMGVAFVRKEKFLNHPFLPYLAGAVMVLWPWLGPGALSR